MTGQVIALIAAVVFFAITRPGFVDRLAVVIAVLWLVCERDWETARYVWRTGVLWKAGE